MEEFLTYEFVVAKKKQGHYALRRLGLILAYVLYLVGLLVGITLFATQFVALYALAPLSLWIIVFFTWRYVSVEYEYSMVSGEMTFSEIYGSRSRKQKLSFRLKDCAMIAPLSTREGEERAQLYGAEYIYSALSSPDAPDRYFAAFEDPRGKKCMVYFEATEKALKICRFYNPSGTVMTKVSR